MAPTPEQRTCIEDTFGKSSAVVAGAGSGKTDTLTRRISYALQHPEKSGVDDIDQILAITYTHKAAEELKSRVKQVLEEEATSENGLRAQALKVDGAWISTIHSMCSRILRENALAFGIDPNFQLAVDETLNTLIGDTIEEVMTSVMYDPSFTEERQLLKEYKRDDIKQYVRLFMTKMAESPDADPLASYVLPPEQDPVEHLLDLVRYAQEMIVRIENKWNEPKAKAPSATEQAYYDKAVSATAAVLGLSMTEIEAHDLAMATISTERLEQLHETSDIKLFQLADMFTNPARNLKIAKEPLDATGILPAESFLRAVSNMQLAVGTRYLHIVLRLAKRTREVFEQKKHDLGFLDNGDLLALVAQKLQDPTHAAIAQRYASQFQLVMVDEFQDTNQMQVDMINLVAGGSSGSLSHKMCVVGDAQQSIYRFRNADLAVFRDYVRRVKESGAKNVIQLGDNFRSHADILAFCKEVFTDVFGAEYLDLLHGRNEEQAALKDGYHDVDASALKEEPRRVNVKMLKAEGNKSISNRAAQEIAHDFRLLVDRGNSAGQMAILLGSMKKAQVYAQALQEVGLKCAITGGSVFSESSDALLIASMCDALLNPYNTEMLLRVLTSDIFRLSADDLIMLVSLREEGRGSLADVFVGNKELAGEKQIRKNGSNVLQHAVSVLRAAMVRVGNEPLSTIVADVLVESGWLHEQSAEGTIRAADAFKALRILERIEKESPVGDFGAIKRFRERLEVAKEAPGVLSTEGDDFVRIMTIHASKGLSIPIVAVAETDSNRATSSALMTLSDASTTYLLLKMSRSIKDLPDKGFVRKALQEYRKHCETVQNESDARDILQAVQQQGRMPYTIADYHAALEFLNRQGDVEEQQRKLYVAYTRAKDALIVTHRTPPKTGTQRDIVGSTVSEVLMRLKDEEVLEEQADASHASEAYEPTRILMQSTSYPQTREKVHEWPLRYQLFTLKDDQIADQDDIPVDYRDEEASAASRAAKGARSLDASLEDLADVQEKRTAVVSFANSNERLPRLVPYRAQWAEGVVSASSLKDASGENVPEMDQDPDDDVVVEAVELAHAFDLSEDSMQEPPAAATERGTAFHALCEWVATHHVGGAPLAFPPEERIRALSRFYGLNARQEEGLDQALVRWLASSAATFAIEHDHLKPEQPFWVQLRPAQEGCAPLILQGFIDLLCYNEENQGSAYVVDYKTGTGYNTEEKRRRAYELQAMCYAYALLKQGFTDVQLDFVFVDQPSSENPNEPILMHFPASDSPSWTADYLQARILEML